jgi:hypothetical protein
MISYSSTTNQRERVREATGFHDDTGRDILVLVFLLAMVDFFSCEGKETEREKSKQMKGSPSDEIFFRKTKHTKKNR